MEGKEGRVNTGGFGALVSVMLRRLVKGSDEREDDRCSASRALGKPKKLEKLVEVLPDAIGPYLEVFRPYTTRFVEWLSGNQSSRWAKETKIDDGLVLPVNALTKKPLDLALGLVQKQLKGTKLGRIWTELQRSQDYRDFLHSGLRWTVDRMVDASRVREKDVRSVSATRVDVSRLDKNLTTFIGDEKSSRIATNLLSNGFDEGLVCSSAVTIRRRQDEGTYREFRGTFTVRIAVKNQSKASPEKPADSRSLDRIISLPDANEENRSVNRSSQEEQVSDSIPYTIL